MIKKIISGGQTGADRAALDFAIKFSIPHGGWIPKGRLTEDGPLSVKYKLQEMPTESYESRTKQNVINSDGTVIFSRGEPTGGTEYTRKMTKKHKNILRHIDLHIATSFDAASLILSWIQLRLIKILNVAGPRASEDPDIYEDVFRILEMAYRMKNVEQQRSPDELSKTVEEAVEKLIAKLSLRDATLVANMEEDDLDTLENNLGVYVGSEFGIWSGNRELLESCKVISDDPYLHPDFAPMEIIYVLWEKLQKTHRLRAVQPIPEPGSMILLGSGLAGLEGYARKRKSQLFAALQ